TITGQGEKHLVEVTVDVDGDRGGATDSVTATGEHPFWVPNRDEWVDAEDLQAGDRVRTAEGEQRLVTSIRTWTALQRVHNLTINNTHTYYAVAGETPILVHNNDCFGDNWSSDKNLDDHYKRHGEEMGFDTMTEYNYAAQDLMCTCDGRRPGVLMKQDEEKVRRFFDPDSGEFGSAGPRGIITYFEPDHGIDYYRGQDGMEVQ
ncbi:polymorphic toxin-type HINT domain-containing protein, partial [Actinopolyspora alba]|uniref:polymorphic toxin-type HINT domain-containing protein n=1 Tax=Actinopolyspora alba TaxID=673379 RepID=UPI001114002A